MENYAVMIYSILGFSLALQFLAAFFALRLIKVSGKSLAWSLIAIAIVLMAVRRGISLFHLAVSEQTIHPDLDAELVALMISILMVAGIERIAPIFREIRSFTDRLKESEERYRNLFEHSPDAIVIADLQSGNITDANPKASQLLLRSHAELMTLHQSQLHPPSFADFTRESFQKHAQETATGKVSGPFEHTVLRADGTEIPVEIMAQMVVVNDRPCLQGVFRDISERKQAEEKLRLTRRIYESTLEGIVVTDAACNIVDVNEAFTRITGYSREEVIGKNPRLLNSGRQDNAFYAALWQAIDTCGHWSGEMWNRRKDGGIYPEWITISAITNPQNQVTHYVGISSDITLLKQHEKQLEHIAHYDALTGIPNRVLLVDRMKQALAQTRREQKLLAVCYLDLDSFKPINDSYGHETGDQILITIAERIKRNLRGGDTVARLGGDEFVILLLGIENTDDCYLSFERLLHAIGQPISIKDMAYQVTASIGVTLYPTDDEDPDTLLRHADQAMYQAKQAGKNRYHVFDPHHDMRIKVNREMRERIEQGLEAGEFELFYQPKVVMAEGCVVGAEALIRWRHPEYGLLSPIEFLPIVENSALEIRLGEWVIETTLQHLENWREQGLEPEVSINLAAGHLLSPDFIDHLAAKLAQHPTLSARQLQIEILETAALADVGRVSEIMDACSALGIRFALDDFGTGYSSLAYLRKLPADTLKIDQSFVRDMLTDAGDFAIVKGIIALAKSFGRSTVAEGVETEAHFQTLLNMGCDIGQGYGIARPMPAAAFAAWLINAQLPRMC
ncbi:MAG: putative bifunctional diguanylate cyclase/phosphodiesterase [Gammaproteobacteria bacterium]